MADTINEKASESPPSDTPPSQEEPDHEFTSINEKALLRKIDAQLLPAVGILYLLSFLDRSNGMKPTQSEKRSKMLTMVQTVGNARIEGLLDDVDMSTPDPRSSLISPPSLRAN